MNQNEKGPGGPVNRPRTFDEAVQAYRAAPGAEDAPEGEEGAANVGDDPVATTVTADQVEKGDIPDWVVFPNDGHFKIPQGEDLLILRFRAQWVKGGARHKGDRVCIMWAISAAEEKVAIMRARGEQGLVLRELAKQAVRSVDAHTADWTGTRPGGNVDRFFDEIGPKCRPIVVTCYNKLHSMSSEDLVDFFNECFVSRNAVAK